MMRSICRYLLCKVISLMITEITKPVLLTEKNLSPNYYVGFSLAPSMPRDACSSFECLRFHAHLCISLCKPYLKDVQRNSPDHPVRSS